MKHITPKITLKGSLLVRLERYNEKHHPGRRLQRSIYELLERALRNEEVKEELLRGDRTVNIYRDAKRIKLNQRPEDAQMFI